MLISTYLYETKFSIKDLNIILKFIVLHNNINYEER